MSRKRVTLMLPSDPEYQGLLADLIGRCCVITHIIWNPFTLANALALGVLTTPKSRYLQGILDTKKVYIADPTRREIDVDAHTTMVSLYPNVLEQLDGIKNLLTAKARSSRGLTRTSVLTALFAWCAKLPNTDLVVLLAPYIELLEWQGEIKASIGTHKNQRL